MRLTVRPMTVDDVPRFTAIQIAAFLPTLGRLLYKRPITPDFVARSEERARGYFAAGSRARLFAVVDADADAAEPVGSAPGAARGDGGGAGRVVAAAKWEVYPGGRGQEEVDEAYRDGAVMGLSPYPAFERDFFAYLNASRRGYMGTRACVFLHILVVDPAYQRRGAGGLLLDWGVAEADRLGVFAYLEGTPAGRPLYERYGFRAVKRTEFRLREYAPEEGEDYVEESWIMLRPAKGEREAGVEAEAEKAEGGKVRG